MSNFSRPLHSLGGTDAQRMAHSFATNGVKEGYISSFTVSTFNAPRIEVTTAQQFLYAVGNCKEHFELIHLRTDGDSIQKFGQVLLGYAPKNQRYPPNLKSTILSFTVEARRRKDKHLAPLTAAKTKHDKDNTARVSHLVTNSPQFMEPGEDSSNSHEDEFRARMHRRV